MSTFNDPLYNELTVTLHHINEQINAARREADEMIIDIYSFKKPDGSFVMAELLVAKAQCLNGMAVLKASRPTIINNNPPGRKW